MRGKRCKVIDCPVYRRAEVPYSGSRSAEIVVVGESPGYEEECRRPLRPFVDDSGKLAKAVAKEVKIKWHNLFVMNSARCRVIKKETSAKEITNVLASCRPHVEAVMRSLKPKAAILFGDFALRQVLKRKGITKARGRWVYSEEFECWCMPTFHPAYILRNQAMRPYLVEDMTKVAEFIANDYEIPGADEQVDHHLDVGPWRDRLVSGDSTGFDTECQGLDWMSPNFVMLSFSISQKKGSAFNVNLYEECEEADSSFSIEWPRKEGRAKVPTLVYVRECEDFDQKVDDLKWYLANDKIKKYMMNGNFDLHALDAFFKSIEETWEINSYALDVQAAAQLLDENMFKMARLEDLQSFFSDYRENYNQAFDTEYDKSDMLAVPVEVRSLYACKDADVTRRIAMTIREELLSPDGRKMARYYARVVHPSLQLTLFELEAQGAWIDREALPLAMEEVGTEMNKAGALAARLIPKKVRNMASHKEKGLALTRNDLVRDTLFSKTCGYKLKPFKFTKSRQPSMDIESRKMMLAGKLTKSCRAFIDHYDKWSRLHTLFTRYLKGFDKHIKDDGRIHSSYSLATAVTGRVASSSPNMMNNPKRSEEAVIIRRLLAAPNGWLLLLVDESQCLVPETELLTIDGVRTLSQVMKFRLPVLSVSDRWTPSFQPVLNAWCTGMKECLRITFEDGSIEVCSMVHRFRRWDGRWAHAEALFPGDKMAHAWFTNEVRGDYYPEIGISRIGYRKDGNPKWRMHKLVGEFLNGGPVPSTHEVHHKDLDKKRWHRENIEVLTKFEHKSLHAAGDMNSNYGKRRGCTKECPVGGALFYRPPSREQEVTCSKRCSNLYFPRRAGKNHKVVSVERVGLRETFQIEVKKNHTYVLANGLISKNSELRWAAHVSRAKSMIRVFRNGEDIHTNTAKSMTANWDNAHQKTKDLARRNAKPVNFGMLFLMQAPGLVQYAKIEYGVLMTEQEAKAYIAAWFREYPELRIYHRKTIDFCRRKGYVESPLGRRRRLPEINSSDKWRRHEAERMAVNHPIQNPSSDTVLVACAEIIDQEMVSPEECFPVMFIHDELVFQVKDNSRVEDNARAVKFALENPPLKRDFGFDLRVPLVADVKIGPNMAETEELKV